MKIQKRTAGRAALICAVLAALLFGGFRIGNTLKEQRMFHDFRPVADETAEWSRTLADSNVLEADLNRDGQTDSIYMECVEEEGAQLIFEFEIQISGFRNPCILNELDGSYRQLDASFEKLELFDLNGDGTDELILMFDSHGAGGQGTHDIYVVWMDGKELSARKVGQDVEGRADLSTADGVDGIYSLEKISWDGEVKLLVRQYAWKGAHSDGFADVLSLVRMEKGADRFRAEDSWTEANDQ